MIMLGRKGYMREDTVDKSKDIVPVSYADLHDLFCGAQSWLEYRLKAIESNCLDNWTKDFNMYCDVVKSQVNKEIMDYAKKIQGEIISQRLLEEKWRKRNAH